MQEETAMELKHNQLMNFRLKTTTNSAFYSFDTWNNEPRPLQNYLVYNGEQIAKLFLQRISRLNFAPISPQYQLQ